MRWLASFLICASCTCRSGVGQVDPPEVTANPTDLAFTAYIGASNSHKVTVSNHGGSTASISVTQRAAFTVTPSAFELVGGESVDVTITFTPPASGAFRGKLRFDDAEISLTGDGLEPPACVAPSLCVDSTFDPNAASCHEAPKQDDSPCSSRCIEGTCQAGTCLGQPSGSCDDHDRCTVDVCGEQAGCAHAPVSCPAPAQGQCHIARCDAQQGCVVEAAPDGTLCGPDDCAAPVVDVCFSGQCTRKPRPAPAHCTGRWVPVTLPPRTRAAMAWDPLRRRVVLFGGAQESGISVLGDTWLWDGSGWELSMATGSPSARAGHAMVFDAPRGRVMLFGGSDGTSWLNDTWEWDGTTWQQRNPLVSPPASGSPAMAYDAARQRVVLFTSDPAGLATETWEWDGTTWAQRNPASQPSVRTRATMAYDAARQRVVLFGGVTSFVPTETWEWDGNDWTLTHTMQQLVGVGTLVYDEVRQRLVLKASETVAFPSSTWEWSASGWVRQTSAGSADGVSSGAVAWDGVGGRVLLVGGKSEYGWYQQGTYAWGGGQWTRIWYPISPGPRTGEAGAWDVARRRLVLHGGADVGAKFSPSEGPWEWAADAGWSSSSSYAPGFSLDRSMAYDEAQRRLVLSGPQTCEFDGSTWTCPGPAAPESLLTWDTRAGHVVALAARDAGMAVSEWTGSVWLPRPTTGAPPPRSHTAIAFDANRGRLVMFGGLARTQGLLADTWELDGTTWLARTPSTSPPAGFFQGMAYDASRGRVVMLDSRSDTWEWDGNDWIRLAVESPPRGSTGPVVYDPTSQRLLFFGLSLFALQR